MLSDALLAAIFDIPGCPLTPAERQAGITRLPAAFASLSPFQREILRLRYMEAVAVRDLARLFSYSDAHMRTLLKKALYPLRMTLNPAFRRPFDLVHASVSTRFAEMYK
jgi:DNA-directed RNA polymerase specialized sigma24 family protein